MWLSGARKAEKLRRSPLKLSRCGREMGEEGENLVVLKVEVEGCGNADNPSDAGISLESNSLD